MDDKMEHRVAELEKDGIEDRATNKGDFEKLAVKLVDICQTLAQYDTKLDNLWQWKLFQNGILTDIRKDQKDIAKSLETLWLKIVGSVVIALILNFLFTR